MKYSISILMIITACHSGIQHKSKRISKSATITLDAGIDTVFPLFGPIREMDWAEGWNPEVIFGERDVEEHMIFQTRPGHSPGEKFTWIVTQFDPSKHHIEYTVSTAERIWFIRVDCVAEEEKTEATVTYEYTSLSEEGVRQNQEAMDSMFARDLVDWEEAINDYLQKTNTVTNL